MPNGRELLVWYSAMGEFGGLFKGLAGWPLFDCLLIPFSANIHTDVYTIRGVSTLVLQATAQ